MVPTWFDLDQWLQRVFRAEAEYPPLETLAASCHGAVAEIYWPWAQHLTPVPQNRTESDRLLAAARSNIAFVGAAWQPYAIFLVELAEDLAAAGPPPPPFVIRPRAPHLFGEMIAIPSPLYDEGALHASAVPVPEVYRNWLHEAVFNFENLGWAPGQSITENLTEAVMKACAGDLLAAELAFMRASAARAYTGGAHDPYILELLGIARRMMNERRIPETLEKTVSEHDLRREPQRRPEPTTAAQRAAIEDLARELSQMSPAEYAESRAAELAAVKAQLLAGNLPLSDAPEAAASAVRARGELAEAEQAAAVEVAGLTAERDEARARRDALAAQLPPEEAAAAKARANARLSSKSARFDKSAAPERGAPEAGKGLAGIRDTWRRVRNQVKASWDDIVDPVAALAQTISHHLLPSEARELGRRLDRERKRLGHRLDQDLQRAVEDIATYAPWIYAVAPFLGWIPVIGQLLTLFVIFTVATVEVAYAAKMKHELDQALRRARAALRDELAALVEEIKELERRIAELQAARQGAVEAGGAARAARVDVLGDVDLVLRRRQKLLVIGTASAAGSGIVAAELAPPKARTTIAALTGLLIVGFATWNELRTRAELDAAKAPPA